MWKLTPLDLPVTPSSYTLESISVNIVQEIPYSLIQTSEQNVGGDMWGLSLDFPTIVDPNVARSVSNFQAQLNGVVNTFKFVMPARDLRYSGGTGNIFISSSIETNNGSRLILSKSLDDTDPEIFNGTYLRVRDQLLKVIQASGGVSSGEITLATSATAYLTLFEGLGANVVTIHPSENFYYASGYGPGDPLSVVKINKEEKTTEVIETYANLATDNPIIIDSAGEYAYFYNREFFELDVYSINQSTGELTFVGSVDPGKAIEQVALSQDEDFLYALAQTGSLITYSIDPSTKDLTFVNSLNITGSGGGGLTDIKVHPDNNFLFVACDHVVPARQLITYTIDESTGIPTFASSINLPAGSSSVRNIEIHPNKKFLYTCILGNDTITLHEINQSTGELTFVNTYTFPAHTEPAIIKISPSGLYAYTANIETSTISVFTIDQTTGVLSPYQEVSTGANTEPRALDIAPSGEFLLVPIFANPPPEGFYVGFYDIGGEVGGDILDVFPSLRYSGSLVGEQIYYKQGDVYGVFRQSAPTNQHNFNTNHTYNFKLDAIESTIII